MASFPAAAGDVTTLNPSGTPQAFALSLADVTRLSGEGLAFPNFRERAAGGVRESSGGHNFWWWLRTPSQTSGITSNFIVRPAGYLIPHVVTMPPSNNGGARPAIIVHP